MYACTVSENCLEIAVILLVYGTEEEGILGSWWCAGKKERKKENYDSCSVPGSDGR